MANGTSNQGSPSQRSAEEVRKADKYAEQISTNSSDFNAEIGLMLYHIGKAIAIQIESIARDVARHTGREW